MQVLTPEEMQQVEHLAYADAYQESHFMEEAGKAVASAALETFFQRQVLKRVILLCGKGNNTGDAYVAGIRLMREAGVDVQAIQVGDIRSSTKLCQEQYARFLRVGGTVHTGLGNAQDLFSQAELIIDGLFGTGFRGKLAGDYLQIVKLAKQAQAPILAIDIPSGLNGRTGEVEGEAIVATETVYLAHPKLGFFLRQGWDHVGKLSYGDFGLPARYSAQVKAKYSLLEQSSLSALLPPLKRSQHKYEAGYLVALAGSPAMPGAAILAVMGALRAGAGIVRLLYPEGMEAELASAPYEIIREPYSSSHLDSVLERVNQASAVLIGPGLGTSSETETLLKAVLKNCQRPMVLDADALNLIAREKLSLPPGAILTPHRAEMHRLLGLEKKQPFDETFLDLCQAYASKQQVVLILKGGPSVLFFPEGSPKFLAHGDPGMATAGTGDVLTGVVAACLAMGLKSQKAAQTGALLHALAGEAAARSRGSRSLIASDLFQGLSETYREF